MPEFPVALSRRAIMAGVLLLPWLPSLARAAPRDLAFAVFRNGAKIGEHHVGFAGDGAVLTATTDARLSVRIGPVPVFRYHHHAVETRRDGAFATMETDTSTNGKKEHVVAERTGGVVHVQGPYGKTTLSGDTNPLNHWDQQIFSGGPLFNPQTGKLMKIHTAQAGPGHWTIRGEADIDDYYNESGVWQSLSGKLEDGSKVEYRRI